MHAAQEKPNKDELTCRYMRHHPMFYIRPVKEELLHLNPRISMFHDVITKAEMDMVRKLARPRVSSWNFIGTTSHVVSVYCSRNSNCFFIKKSCRRFGTFVVANCDPLLINE